MKTRWFGSGCSRSRKKSKMPKLTFLFFLDILFSLLTQINGDWPCVCSGGAPIDYQGIQVAKLSTFDGFVLKLTADQKTLVARSLPSDNIPDACIFKLAVESDARFKQPLIRIDWAALGIGQNPHSGDIFRRNFQLGLDKVYRRGKGIHKMVCQLPYRFDKKGTTIDIKLISETETHAVFRLSSPTCNIQLDYVQDLVTFRDEFTLSVGSEYAGNMEGLCGSCDGIASNDKRYWHSNSTKIRSTNPKVYGRIAKSYAYGTHQHDHQQRLMDLTGIHLGDPWSRVVHRLEYYHRRLQKAGLMSD